jgi:hypothetical protein
MKRKHIVVLIAVMLCVSLAGIAAAQSNGPNAAVTTKFTYQGQIKRAGALFDGTCNMRFTLWDAATAGVQQASYIVPAPVTVSDGVFAVEVDFGAQFKGDARWIQTETQCADDAGYTTLPRVALTAVPYALYSAAPWVTAISNTIYYNGGNVGIGTTSPTSKLEIAAQDGLAITGFQPFLTLRDTNNANKRSVIQGADGRIIFYPDSFIGGVPAMMIDNVSGNVGIGTINPAAKLQVLDSGSGIGVYGTSATGSGVVGVSGSWVGVYGESASQTAVWGKSTTASGVVGSSGSYVGVWGESTSFEGVRGVSHNVDHGGVVGVNDAAGGVAVYGIAPNGGYAAWFNGRTKTNVLEITGGSDLAEQFNISEDKADPGTLLIIDAANPGHLTISLRAYDTRVAGIVSGAGDIKPGLTLHQAGIMEGNTEVAIAGRVYVKATAVNGAIKPGDLLTTSDVAGYAMKATDRDQAYGAVIGKAMTGLDKGEGLVLVLVNLQ